MTNTRGVELVVKLGGGLLAYPDHFTDTLDLIVATAQRRRLVVVPGGGSLADAVRELDRQLDLGDDAAHWMAVLAMDQHAHLLVAKLRGSVLVQTKDAINAALNAGEIPILAPYNWLHDADPLPHSWDVTSDSIAAWIAGDVAADRLILIKPPDATEPLVDAYFSRALPAHVPSTVVRAGTPLHTALAAC